jgi:hypothetical protein
MEIPVYIFHIGDQEYFKKCVEINSLKNKVYILGNDTNKDLFKKNDNVVHIHVKDIDNGEVNRLKNCFVNYSSSDINYEIKCFLRVFYLKQLMLITGINSFFHVDSDCIIYENISEIFNQNPHVKNAYSLQKNYEKTNPHHMVGCIHNGLISLELCEVFIQLCYDIYENKSKLNLIQNKINYHKQQNIGGGICDMTFFWLIYSEKFCEIHDLNDIIFFENEKCTFDHNINIDYGFLGDGTYKKFNNIKSIINKDNKKYAITNSGEMIRLLSIHFAGGAKKILETLPIN